MDRRDAAPRGRHPLHRPHRRRFGQPDRPGRDAFAGESHGYTTTQCALAPLAGRKVRFRWRLGSDAEVGALGWMVDDVHVYRTTTQAVSRSETTCFGLRHGDVTTRRAGS